MKGNISKNQVELLRQLCIYRQEHGISPSFRELKKLAKVSDVKSVYRMIKILEDAELLEKEKGKSRSLKLTYKGMEAIGLYSFPIKFEDISSSFHSQESLQYSDKSLETDSTYSSPKEIVMKSFSSVVHQLTNTKGYITKLGSAILLLLLFWGTVAITGMSSVAFVYPILLFYVISNFHK